MSNTFPKPKVVFDDVCAVSTAALIDSYRVSIDVLRDGCAAELAAHKAIERADPNFGDDLFLLRFVLSHHNKGGYATAREALLKTIIFRAQNQDVLAGIRLDKEAPPADDRLRPCILASPHYRTPHGHFIYLVRNGMANGPLALERVGGQPQLLTQWMVLSKEFLHARCDEETRSRGQLIKMIILMDFTFGSLSSYNGNVREAMTTASRESETFYPQLLHRTVIFNMPGIIGSVLGFFVKLFPKSLQEKLLVCRENNPLDMVEWVEKHLGMKLVDLPTFLGGSCDCGANGCIRGWPNDHPAQLTNEDLMIHEAEVATWSQFMARANDRQVAALQEE